MGAEVGFSAVAVATVTMPPATTDDDEDSSASEGKGTKVKAGDTLVVRVQTFWREP